jgi:cytochrome c oxidase subunit II
MGSLFHPASLQGVTMSGDWLIFIVAASIVAAIVYTLIFIPLIVWRERPERVARQFNSNTTLEITSVVIPLLLVMALFVITYGRETSIDSVSAHPQAIVDVTAFRWSWQFDYPDTGIRNVGTPLTPPTLYLPIGRTTEIDLRTADVNHSFWVPAFLFKRDAIPGMVNRFDLTPSRLGTYVSRCAQFCGLDHALMSFNIQVVPDEAFDRYIASHGATTP